MKGAFHRVMWPGVVLAAMLSAGCSNESETAAAPPTAAATTQPMSEEQKIEALIRSVAELGEAIFIRNGTEHSAAEAAEHMRSKWNSKKKEIKTAEQFIEKLASKSSISGKAYEIRFGDGRKVTSGEFLRGELEKLGRGE